MCPPVVGRGRTAPGRAGGQVGGERSPGGAEEAGQAGQGGQGRLGGSQGGRCLLRGGVVRYQEKSIKIQWLRWDQIISY